MLAMRHYYKSTRDKKNAKIKNFAVILAENIVQLQILGFEQVVLKKDNKQTWETLFKWNREGALDSIKIRVK